MATESAAARRLPGGLLTLLLGLGLWLALSAPASAGLIDTPAEALQVSLITYGPGDTYWERFGHDAIELRDTLSGQRVNFNYGVFDFDEKGFLLHFARGQMRYMMDAEPAAEDDQSYIDAGRSVTRQVLALTPQQAAELRRFLLWNLQPEHLHYRYDYFQSNCATRVRDALDRALGGQLASTLQARPGGYTYRQQTDRLMAAQPWLMLLLDLGLGPFADHPINAWQASFLPAVLSAQLADLRLADGRPLVSRRETLAPQRLPPPDSQPPALFMPLLLSGLLWAGLLVLSQRYWPLGQRLLASLFLLPAGLLGLVLAGLWLLTGHYAAWDNANLLLFNPLAWLWLGPVWRRQPPSRGLRIVGYLQLAALGLALLLPLAPHAQHNAPWLALALPIWLVLLRQRLRPRSR